MEGGEFWDGLLVSDWLTMDSAALDDTLIGTVVAF